MTKEINGERAYPIYQIEVSWIQDGEYDEKYPRWYKGLRDGRMRNNTGFSRMEKNETEFDTIRKDALKWWGKYKREKLEGKNPGRPKITITGPKYETWCLTWFQHFTFDDGRPDKEFLESFERYVHRYEYMQDYPPGSMPGGYVCLMGAEDRWRWTGAMEGYERTPVPCRCEHCKEQGVVRIGH